MPKNPIFSWLENPTGHFRQVFPLFLGGAVNERKKLPMLKKQKRNEIDMDTQLLKKRHQFSKDEKMLKDNASTIRKDVSNSLFLFFAKLGYMTAFFGVFSLSYSFIFPTMEGPDYTRPFQVFLQLSLYLLQFRPFTTKEEKEAKWLLVTSTFYSVVATLFLKNLVSLEGLVFMAIPLFCFLILRLPSDVLPFAILLFYSLEKGLAQWAFCLLFQLVAYSTFCFFLEARPQKSIFPCILLLLYFYFLGKVAYNVDFLHEPARLTALVSGACIIFLCFRRRSKLSFFCTFFIYFLSSIGIGVVSIASAPGGENISCPIPFLFILCHVFLFLGLFL